MVNEQILYKFQSNIESNVYSKIKEKIPRIWVFLILKIDEKKKIHTYKQQINLIKNEKKTKLNINHFAQASNKKKQ